MPYLNLDLDYFTHPKTSRLVGLLGRGAAELPIRLWAYCGKHHSESGSLAGYSAQEIETVVGWWGGTGKMVEAMLNIGFIDKIENGFKIHGWKEHAGHLAVFKKRAKSAAKERWKRYARSNTPSNAKSEITNAPYLTLPYLTNKEQIHPKTCDPPLSGEGLNGLLLGKSKGQKKKAKSRPKPVPLYQPEWVDLFWNEYPNKMWRPNLNVAFEELNPNEELFGKIMDGLERAKKSKEWAGDGGKFIPHPAKFISGRGWENQYITTMTIRGHLL